jgi:topoisomerase-4 subunit A
MKAQGNQLTKLKVKEIVLTHPIEGSEPWPEDSVEEIEVEELDDDSIEEGDDTTVEWDLTKKDDDEDQMTLF